MNRKAQWIMITVEAVILLAVLQDAAEASGNDGRTATGFLPYDLRCEYLRNPLGIDANAPRLSWKLQTMRSNERGLQQSAYQVLVASTAEALRREQNDLWDSGRVNSDQSIHVPYAGKALQSRMKCWWKVRVWDKHGHVSAWSEPAFWSMGLLKQDDWNGAKWIGLDEGDDEPNERANEHRRLPARYLRREFEVGNPVRQATAYVCGLGFFDLHINGQLIGDQLMSPALTGYDKRALYMTFDVTANLRRGKNAIGVVLSNGRFFAPRVKIPVSMHNYGYPRLLLQLHLKYDDGTEQTLVSDELWKLTGNGPIRSSSEYDGEEYDARLEMSGWTAAGFDDSLWRPAQVMDVPGGQLEAQMVEPIRVTEILQPARITNPKPGIFMVDFGQAFYGVVRLKVCGPAGARVTMRTSFNVLGDGMLNYHNDRSALNTDIYILKGNGIEVWHPRFRGNATRWVQVEGFPGTPTQENFAGLVTHTDHEPVGQFSCSNELVNRIYQNARWGTRLQNRSVPMEPDRDERMPWSGHPAKTSESEGWVFNVARFYEHYLHNYRIHQEEDG